MATNQSYRNIMSNNEFDFKNELYKSADAQTQVKILEKIAEFDANEIPPVPEKPLETYLPNFTPQEIEMFRLTRNEVLDERIRQIALSQVSAGFATDSLWKYRKG